MGRTMFMGTSLWMLSLAFTSLARNSFVTAQFKVRTSAAVAAKPVQVKSVPFRPSPVAVTASTVNAAAAKPAVTVKPASATVNDAAAKPAPVKAVLTKLTVPVKPAPVPAPLSQGGNGADNGKGIWKPSPSKPSTNYPVAKNNVTGAPVQKIPLNIVLEWNDVAMEVVKGRLLKTKPRKLHTTSSCLCTSYCTNSFSNVRCYWKCSENQSRPLHTFCQCFEI